MGDLAAGALLTMGLLILIGLMALCFGFVYLENHL